jgi:hypothetical protein
MIDIIFIPPIFITISEHLRPIDILSLKLTIKGLDVIIKKYYSFKRIIDANLEEFFRKSVDTALKDTKSIISGGMLLSYIFGRSLVDYPIDIYTPSETCVRFMSPGNRGSLFFYRSQIIHKLMENNPYRSYYCTCERPDCIKPIGSSDIDLLKGSHLNIINRYSYKTRKNQCIYDNIINVDPKEFMNNQIISTNKIYYDGDKLYIYDVYALVNKTYIQKINWSLYDCDYYKFINKTVEDTIEMYKSDKFINQSLPEYYDCSHLWESYCK